MTVVWVGWAIGFWGTNGFRLLFGSFGGLTLIFIVGMTGLVIEGVICGTGYLLIIVFLFFF